MGLSPFAAQWAQCVCLAFHPQYMFDCALSHLQVPAGLFIGIGVRCLDSHVCFAYGKAVDRSRSGVSFSLPVHDTCKSGCLSIAHSRTAVVSELAFAVACFLQHCLRAQHILFHSTWL